ncbi:MAG: hypothetical protein PHF97_03595 [Bacteroidales bacterium]|nr:hypothetical protein [Bacteroidales bacterium]
MTQAVDNKPYRLMAFKEFVPETMRFWIYIIWGVIFHLSGGIYIALASQMVGSLALLQEDVIFAGFSAFVGMTIIFPVLFRLKFRFTNKTLLLTASIGLIICNIITMNSSSLPVLVVVCFFAGILRVMGFFECMSTIQLKITPTRDFAKFFPVVYLVVLGCIQLSGITAGYMSYFYRWEYMNILAIGMLSVVAISCALLLRHFRAATPQPFTGIDWLGAFLWSLLIMLIIFVLEYGEHYDWLDSAYIRMAIAGVILIFGMIYWRSKYIQRPYIDLHVFKHRHVNTIIYLFTAMCLLMATPNVLQNAYTGVILNYDMLTTLSLNWPVLAGIIAGAVFSYLAMVKWGCSYKFVTGMGFAFIVFYVIAMYFLISPATRKEQLYLPLFFRGAGNVVIYVVLTVYAARTIPFMPFFQVLTVLGFVRTCVGIPLGTAIIGRALSICTKKDMMSLGSEIDLQNPIVNTMPFNRIMEEVHRQALMVSIKEIFGYAAIAGVFILILSLCTRYKSLIKWFKMPRWE